MTEDRRQYLTVPKLTEIPWLVHGFGDAGWSEADFLAFAASRGLKPVIMRQLHSDIVHRLDAPPAEGLEGDALMTDIAGLLLVIRTADCLPVFLVDTKNRAVAAVHCGWRGTEKRILEKAVRAMAEAYGSKPPEMLAAMGPCIGGSCYEVGPEVRDSFLGAGFPPSALAESPGRPGKSLLDLRSANLYLLEISGVKKANIHDPGLACTHCAPSLLSYRRDPGESRRMYNFIGLAAG
jgi:purine-nucleoside/S-methyl-5'-thioadenosine phosphorylase / adenosine deaminase